uniref:Uncharacterized protein n=1 Tax=Salix viminalis TaxID=40686 RepID=A0A6N2KBE7_SALVM
MVNTIFGQTFKKCPTNIRASNSMFAFTSKEANINGHCHHLMGSLLPSYENAPKFAHLNIYDVANEVSNQMSLFPRSTFASSLDETIDGDLIRMLATTNCLVGLFHHASLKLLESVNLGCKLQLLCQRTHDRGQYNDLTLDDIGGLIVEHIGDYWSPNS